VVVAARSQLTECAGPERLRPKGLLQERACALVEGASPATVLRGARTLANASRAKPDALSGCMREKAYPQKRPASRRRETVGRRPGLTVCAS